MREIMRVEVVPRVVAGVRPSLPRVAIPATRMLTLGGICFLVLMFTVGINVQDSRQHACRGEGFKNALDKVNSRILTLTTLVLR